VQPYPSADNLSKKLTKLLIDLFLESISVTISKTLSCPTENYKLVKQLAPEVTFSELVSRYGYRGFFYGNSASVLRFYPTQLLNILLKDYIKNMFRSGEQNQKSWSRVFVENLLSGALVGTLSLLLVYPLDTARTLMALDLDGNKYKNVLDCLRKIIHERGIGGLYAGFMQSILGILLYRALYFGLYDSAKAFGGLFQNSFIFSFFLGWIVTTLAGLLSYPIDTIRRVQMLHSFTASEAQQFIINKRGIMGFFAGAGSNVWRSIVGAAVLMLYDSLRQALRRAL